MEEIESLGFRAVWIGGSPTLDQMRPYLERSSTLTIASGILNVWRNDPAEVAEGTAALRNEFGGRFLLGLGIGHPEATSEYTKPLTKMRAFLDGLDSAPAPVPVDQRVLAALGPKMLDLSAERSLGTHPYFTTPEHTRFARERVGHGRLVAPEVAVVLDPDAETGRAKARAYASRYLQLRNYASNLLRFEFTEEDVADGGSDRLVDAVVPHGSPDQIADTVRAHLDAGADHVCVQPIESGRGLLADYRALASALL
jgi:probable F420-dependent oxidoreductase